MWWKHLAALGLGFGVYTAERYGEVMFPNVPANVWLSLSVASWVFVVSVLYGHKSIERWFKGLRRQPARDALGAVSTAPVPKVWIARPEALAILGASSLVRLRVPVESFTVGEWMARWMAKEAGLPVTKTPGETHAEELQRNLLRKFEAQHPRGVSNEKYGQDLLMWWIDEQAAK